MKFKVFTENKEVEKEKEVYFRLIEELNDKITLAACDENGNTLPRGYVLDIVPGKEICLLSDVSEEIGLPLDSLRQVKTG